MVVSGGHRRSFARSRSIPELLNTNNVAQPSNPRHTARARRRPYGSKRRTALDEAPGDDRGMERFESAKEMVAKGWPGEAAMFNRGGDSAGSERHGQSILHEGVSVQGEVEVPGNLRVDGHLKGKISVSACLTIGATGNLEAEIEVNDLLVMGTIVGTVRARGRVELKRGSRVLGDIVSSALVIEDGGFFRGQSVMDVGRPMGEVIPLDLEAAEKGRAHGESGSKGIGAPRQNKPSATDSTRNGSV
jgi:cytoskeletal protein CcmA (bactofilin family)